MARGGLFIFLCFLVTFSYTQPLKISGTITDAFGEPLMFAHIYESKSEAYSIADENGYYSLTLNKGIALLQYSFAGFKTKDIQLRFTTDTVINIRLESMEIEAVNIYAKDEMLHRQTLSGKISLSKQKIEMLPTFIGEPDLLKALTTIPGITGNNKGFSQIFVRGGGRENNLFLLDDAPVYSSNHLFGILSVINTDVVKNVDVYKGGFPARYGGRTSSVIEISSIEGNDSIIRGRFNAGVLKTKFFLEGPLSTPKTNFILGVRTSYLDLLTGAARLISGRDFDFISYQFADINTKITHSFNSKNKLYVSYYFGADRFEVPDDNDHTFMRQLNNSATVGYISQLATNFSLKTNVSLTRYTNIFSSYRGEVVVNETISTTTNESQHMINNLTYNLRFDYKPTNRHYIKTGAKYTNYQFKPFEQSYIYEDIKENYKIDTTWGENYTNKAHQLSVYAEDEFHITPMLNINAGLRYTIFGKDEWFYAIEPRISLRWLATDNFSVKTAYTLMQQPIHIMGNNMQGFSGEIWLGSKSGLPPQKAKQVSTGFFGNIPHWDIELGIEGYYKTMNNLLFLYYYEIEPEVISTWEDMIHRRGRGKSYGMEFTAQMRKERFSTSLSYTLSRSYRQFNSMNFGKWYPHLQDRCHDFNINGVIRLGKKTTLSINFVLNTGTPVTVPEAYIKNSPYYRGGYYAISHLNNYRLPLFHRLDLSLKVADKSRWGTPSWWSFDFYNAYARQNAVFIYFKNGQPYQKALNIILPSINWGMSF